MDSFEDIVWDVVICGTSLQQSLLALALSRSDKHILHIDPNDYYGGSEAALSLQEAEEWASKVSASSDSPASSSPLISAASVAKPPAATTGLSPSRSYSLALAPQFFHARSELITRLVSSRAYRQLEFLAVGSFFVLEPPASAEEESRPTLARIPSTREDVFSSSAIPARSKRQLMKFLKFVLNYDEEPQTAVWEPHADGLLRDFLQTEFKLDESLRTYVLALTVSIDGKVTVREGLASLRRHMSSMGAFGPGFAAVYPKWGGSSEIAQVGCRAGAVGGAVYMLGTGIKELKPTNEAGEMEIELTSGMLVKTKMLVRGNEEAPAADDQRISRLVAVVDSPLLPLFEPVVEGAPLAGGAVVAIPPGSAIAGNGIESKYPVYVMAHLGETGECPDTQSVLYFTTPSSSDSKKILEGGLSSLLEALGGNGAGSPSCLYQLYYEQARGTPELKSTSQIIDLPALPFDLAFNDSVLDVVHEAWRLVTGVTGTAADDASGGDDGFMVFADREGVTDDEDL